MQVVGLAHDRPCLLLCGCTVLLLVLAMAVIGPGLMTFTEPGNNDWVVSTRCVITRVSQAFRTPDHIPLLLC